MLGQSLRRDSYCLSYTATFFTVLPCGSVAVVVTVRVLPSADTTIRPVRVTFPPFLLVNANVRPLTTLYDRMSHTDRR